MSTVSGLGLGGVGAGADAVRGGWSPRVDDAGDVGVFRSVLGRAVLGGSEQAQARRSAEELVAIALIQPVLKGLRESSDAAPPFAPGPYEKQFGMFMDAELSRRLVKAQNFPLVDRVARDLLRMGQTTEGSPDEHTRDATDAQFRRS